MYSILQYVSSEESRLVTPGQGRVFPSLRPRQTRGTTWLDDVSLKCKENVLMQMSTSKKGMCNGCHPDLIRNETGSRACFHHLTSLAFHLPPFKDPTRFLHEANSSRMQKDLVIGGKKGVRENPFCSSGQPGRVMTLHHYRLHQVLVSRHFCSCPAKEKERRLCL